MESKGLLLKLFCNLGALSGTCHQQEDVTPENFSLVTAHGRGMIRKRHQIQLEGTQGEQPSVAKGFDWQLIVD